MKNRIQIEGRLTADVEIKTGKGEGEAGKPFTLMTGSVAYETEAASGKDKDGKAINVNFVNFQSWSEALIGYMGGSLKKGTPVILVGEPIQNSYLDKEGEKQQRLRIAVERINILHLPPKVAATEAAAQA